MASCERPEPSFVRKSLSALPGILLLTGVAVFSWFITPRLIALHPFMKSLRACLETHLSIMKRFNSMLAMAI